MRWLCNTASPLFLGDFGAICIYFTPIRLKSFESPGFNMTRGTWLLLQILMWALLPRLYRLRGYRKLNKRTTQKMEHYDNSPFFDSQVELLFILLYMIGICSLDGVGRILSIRP